MQLPFAQTYVSTAVQSYFNQNFHGTLEIGSVTGFIPFSVKLEDVKLLETDSAETAGDTLISTSRIDIRVNPLDFFRRSISVQSLHIHEPIVRLTLENNGEVYKIERAFQRLEQQQDQVPPRLEDLEIFAPFLTIADGLFVFEKRQPGLPPDSREAPLLVENIQLSVFAELSQFQRYLDVYFLFADVPEWSEHTFRIRGQVFNDNRFLEMNAFRVELGESIISITGEADGVDVLSNDFREQLLKAPLAARIDTAYIRGEDLTFIHDGFNDIKKPLILQLQVEGRIDDLSVIQSRFSYGKSELEFVGDLQHVLDTERLYYDGYLRQFRIDTADLNQVVSQTVDFSFKDWNLLTLQGRVFGTVYRTDADLIMNTQKGKILLQGDIQWVEEINYKLQLTSEMLNLAQFTSLGLPESSINAIVAIEGKGFQKENAQFEADLSMFNTRVGAFAFDELSVQGEYRQGDADALLQWLKNGSLLESSITLITNGRQELYFGGSATAFNLRELMDFEVLAETELNLEFDIQLNDFGTENMTGIVSLDVFNGIVNGREVGAHQLYADLLESPSGERTFRFTSTLADAQIQGDVFPKKISQMIAYWIDYVEERVDDEFIFNEESLAAEASEQELPDINVGIDLQIKDLSLLGAYFPQTPYINTQSALTAQIIASNTRFLMTGRVISSNFEMEDIRIRDSDIQFSSSFQHGRRIQDFSTIDIQVATGAFQKGTFEVDQISSTLSMLNESALFQISTQRVGNETYRMSLTALTELTDSTIYLKVSDFDLGSSQYTWSLDREAVARYTQDKKFHIDDLRLANAAQLIDIRGTYSYDLEDIMQYSLINVDLAQISAVIAGRSAFEGIVDGEFSTQSLLREPAVTGNLFVDGFAIDGRIIGDVAINSFYDAISDRFNTNIRVVTDVEKYADYLAKNRGVGNDITIAGWFKTPDGSSGAPADTLYYFDVDVAQLDGWILVPIIPDVIVQSEGKASGTGIFTGNAEDFYFNAKIDVEEVQIVPQFVFTNYRLSGEVSLDRHDGISLNNIAVRDLGNGTGVLNGTVGFNDFQQERPFNLTLTLNRLQFLNNTFSNDVPFYGTVAGTGSVALTGSNLAPYLRTIIPVTTTANSRLTIPLLAETSVEEQSRFIEFVKSFDELFQPRDTAREEDTGSAFRELTFVEIARLDLQFIAPPATTVQLLFDPLTGEVLNAQGSGRIRITLEDEEFQMFGNFNVTSGEYTFVAGDIFLRRFQLRNGGTINWEGDPANAQLNMTAAYRARPNIGVLTGRSLDLQTRIPVDLMLEITGTIQSIENDFFFEFPNAVDVTQNATELALLNSEDQKLIQATSLLFTGGFLPVGVGGDGQFADLGTSLQSRAGQVGLSQLLSNQINTLLNSNLSNLDVDLNLTGFDQADLGIALRLFDDRLILRGESQFYTASETGAETMLGDLGVTYRINRNLSVEVFHRRDPTLRSIVGNQTQAESINGIGLEAQVQFNTWRELRQRWWGQIRRVFGRSDIESENDRQLTNS